MKKFREVQIQEIAEIVCDRCLKTFDRAEPDFQEIQSLSFTCGYGSTFGDGKNVDINICQTCLMDTLGQ